MSDAYIVVIAYLKLLKLLAVPVTVAAVRPVIEQETGVGNLSHH